MKERRVIIVDFDADLAKTLPGASPSQQRAIAFSASQFAVMKSGVD